MNCECHDQPMYWSRDARYRAGGFWRCRVLEAERRRKYYDNMDGVAYNRLIMLGRRNKALARMRKRHRLPEEA